MMLIFDKFPNQKQAEKFAHHVATIFNLKTFLYMDQDSSDVTDVFPFHLEGPIVHVARPIHDAVFCYAYKQMLSSSTIEEMIEKDVEKFGGRFAGT